MCKGAGTVRDELGMTSSILSGTRLNGSLGSDNRCALIVAMSMLVFDEGSVTGSFIREYMRGSGRDITVSACKCSP